MSSVLSVGEVKRVLLQVEECRYGLSCTLWDKWYMYVVYSKSVYCCMWRISCSVRG